MAVKIVPDLGAPIAVVAADLITEAQAPTYNEWASYIMAGGGYIGAFMGYGGDFVKNVGIASLPWAAKKIYERVQGGAVTASRPMSFKRAPVARYPAPHQETPFQRVKLV